MAYSEDTQAIIDRLKSEGDLIRSGTNSVKSLNIKLEKFDGLFKSINNNIIAQTSMMQKQIAVTVDASERSRAKEQFDEVSQTPTADQTDDYDKGKGKGSKIDTDKAIDKMGDGLAKAFSFKNLLLAAGAGFVGVNFIKGFVEEFGGIRPLLKELGVPESTFTSMESLGTSFTEMKTAFTGLTGPEGSITIMSESLADIGTTLSELNKKFETILNIDWADIAWVAMTSLSAFGVACAALRLKLTRMRLDLERGTADKAGRTWWQQVLGVDKDGGPYVPPETTPTVRPGTGQNGPAGGAKAPVIPEVDAPVTTGQRGRGSFGIDTPEGRASVRADAASMRSGKFTFDSKGRLQNTGGGYASDKAALEALEKSLDPRYSKIFKNIIRASVVVGVVFAGYDIYQIYHILNNTSGQYDSDEKKINAIGPIIGPTFTGIAAGVLGGALGFTVGGPWGSLVGGLVFGVGAAFLTPDAFGIMLAKGLFGILPSDEDKAILMAGQVSPRPTASGVQGDYGRNDWDTNYGNTHSPLTGMPLGNLNTSPTVTPYTSSGRGSIVEGPGDRFPQFYKQGADGTGAGYNEVDENGRLILYDAFGNPAAINDIQNNGPLGRMLRGEVDLSMGGAGGTTIVNAPVIAPSPVTVTNGGSQVTQVAFSGGGGSAGGPSLTIYGLTGSIA